MLPIEVKWLPKTQYQDASGCQSSSPGEKQKWGRCGGGGGSSCLFVFKAPLSISFLRSLILMAFAALKKRNTNKQSGCVANDSVRRRSRSNPSH